MKNIEGINVVAAMSDNVYSDADKTAEGAARGAEDRQSCESCGGSGRRQVWSGSSWVGRRCAACDGSGCADRSAAGAGGSEAGRVEPGVCGWEGGGPCRTCGVADQARCPYGAVGTDASGAPGLDAGGGQGSPGAVDPWRLGEDAAGADAAGAPGGGGPVSAGVVGLPVEAAVGGSGASAGVTELPFGVTGAAFVGLFGLPDGRPAEPLPGRPSGVATSVERAGGRILPCPGDEDLIRRLHALLDRVQETPWHDGEPERTALVLPGLTMADVAPLLQRLDERVRELLGTYQAPEAGPVPLCGDCCERINPWSWRPQNEGAPQPCGLCGALTEYAAGVR